MRCVCRTAGHRAAVVGMSQTSVHAVTSATAHKSLAMTRAPPMRNQSDTRPSSVSQNRSSVTKSPGTATVYRHTHIKKKSKLT